MAIGDTMTKTAQYKPLPSTADEVCSKKNIKWSCSTTKILDAQKIEWSLFYSPDHNHMVDAFNYGDGVQYDTCVNEASTMVGRVFIPELHGNAGWADTVIHKGDIKDVKFRDLHGNVLDDMGDLYLKMNAFIRLNMNKYTGYVQFQCIGKSIISMSFHIDPILKSIHGDNWYNNLHGMYNGRMWKG